MTRARVKALHEKVNSILSTLDLNTTLDEMLPQADVLCVIRYKPREECVKVDPASDKEGGPLQLENASQDRHYRPLQAGTTARRTPTLPTRTHRHCRPEHPGTAGQGTLALPPEASEAQHRPGPALPPQYHRHCQPHQSQLHLNRIFIIYGHKYFIVMPLLSLGQIWTYMYLIPHRN
jgi:hypothetical protein